MKVLVADKLEASAIRALSNRNIEVDSRPALGPSDLSEALAEGFDVLVVRSTKVDAAAIGASDRLKLIVRAGAGYDTIDTAAASRAGVFVANCPGKNSIAVAELTWGLLLACDRRIAAQDRDLKAGGWDKKGYAKARGVFGRTLGVIGLGSIGCEVVRRARAFGMPVVAWSRSLTSERAVELKVERAATPLEVASRADVVTLHVAATDDTRHLVDAGFIDAMKPGAVLINTTRGSVVDEAALLEGLDGKDLRAGLDVYASEPGSGDSSFDSQLAAHPSVVGTHHIGASTEQAQEAIAAEVARIISVYDDSGEVEHCVNLASRAIKPTLLTVRHKNRPGVLAKVFDVLSRSQINVEEMENILYAGAETACARIQVGRLPEQGELQQIRSSTDDILSVELST